MFKLKSTVARNSVAVLDDLASIKLALTSLGYYDDSTTGLSPYADNQLFTSVKAFQKDNNLAVDGVIHPEGPTHSAIKEKLTNDPKSGNAFGDFWRNYWDMREADTIDADKYFHCKANYEASERGWDGIAGAEFISNMREAGNLAFDSIRKGPLNTAIDTMADQRANKHGRDASRSGKFSSAKEACAIFRPKSLDDKY